MKRGPEPAEILMIKALQTRSEKYSPKKTILPHKGRHGGIVVQLPGHQLKPLLATDLVQAQVDA